MNPELLFSSKSVELKSLHGGEGTHGRMTWNVKYTGLATPIITIFGKACGGMDKGKTTKNCIGGEKKGDFNSLSLIFPSSSVEVPPLTSFHILRSFTLVT